MNRRVLLAVAALATLVLVAGATSVALADTPPLDYYYWYAGAQAKLYPTTTHPTPCARASHPTTKTLWLTAAQGEFEGRQIAIRPNLGAINDIWLEASDLVMSDASGPVSVIPAGNVSFYKVGYVYVRYPSYGYSLKGYQPDPLIPMTLANGEKLGWRPGLSPTPVYRAASLWRTLPFYMLVNVPPGTKPGNYMGTVKITAKGSDGSIVPDVNVSVGVTVYPFSIATKTLPTAFGLEQRWVGYTATPSHRGLPQGSTGGPGSSTVTETTSYYADQTGLWFKYMSDHRIAPSNLLPAWDGFGDWRPGAADGTMKARQDLLADYVSPGSATTFPGTRYNFNAIAMPEYGGRQLAYLKNPFASASYKQLATTYYSTMRAELAPYLWKTYIYVIDEPHAYQRTAIENYGAFVHRVAPGVKFLCTVPSAEFSYKPPKNVDIFVQRLHFYYRDYGRWVSPIRRSGKKVWIYSHGTSFQSQVPMYLLDKPLPEVRAMGWFAWDSRAAGMLYYNIDRWVPGKAGASNYRDPYKDTLSSQVTYNGRPMRSNGDGSLIYPGYYPAYGLNVQGAAPVGSLRMEALRDGLEDYEYIHLLQQKQGYGVADYYMHQIVGKPKTVVSSGRATFPAYPKTSSPYASVRDKIARLLSQ